MLLNLIAFVPLFIESLQCAKHRVKGITLSLKSLQQSPEAYDPILHTNKLELREVEQLAQVMMQTWNLNPDCPHSHVLSTTMVCEF